MGGVALTEAVKLMSTQAYTHHSPTKKIIRLVEAVFMFSKNQSKHKLNRYKECPLF